MLSFIANWWSNQSLGRWLKANTVLFFICRIQVLGSSPYALRFYYICRNRLYADAEQAAEQEAFQLLHKRGLKPGPDCTMKWNKGRFITRQTLRTESEATLELLNHLRTDRGEYASTLVQTSTAVPQEEQRSRVA